MKLYQIKNVLIASLIILILGHFTPLWLELEPQFVLSHKKYNRGISNLNDSLIKDTMEIDLPKPKNSIEVLSELLNPSKKKTDWKRKIPLWRLHKGFPFLLQVHQATNTLSSLGCTITKLKEHTSSNFVILNWNCPGSPKKHQLRIEKGTTYLNASSKLAIVFKVKKADIKLLNAINEFKAPLNLMYENKKSTKKLVEDLSRIPAQSRTILGALQPPDDNQTMYGELIRIYYTEQQIESYIHSIFKNNQDAQWVAFKHGGLARKNSILLDKVFKVLKKNKLQFIDVMTSNRPLLKNTCIKTGVDCLFTSPTKKSKSTEAKIDSALMSARKTGKNILVLAASVENIKIVTNKIEKMTSQGTQLVSLDEM